MAAVGDPGFKYNGTLQLKSRVGGTFFQPVTQHRCAIESKAIHTYLELRQPKALLSHGFFVLFCFLLNEGLNLFCFLYTCTKQNLEHRKYLGLNAFFLNLCTVQF